MKKILFVDDSSEWCFLVGTWLHGAGYAVVTARDSAKALTLAVNGRPDLAILDVDLSGQDGVSLMKRIKKERADIPVILFTGMNHDDDSILGFMRNGAHQYVRKGKMEDLLKAVQTILDFEPRGET